MKVARTTNEEIRGLADILREMEQLSNELGTWSTRFDKIDFSGEGFELFGDRISTSDPERCLRDLLYYIKKLNWQRVLLNCSTMLEQCTDPDQDVLDHSKEIREGLALLKKSKISKSDIIIEGAVHQDVKGFNGQRSIILHNPEFLTNADALSAYLTIGRPANERPKVFLTKQLGVIRTAFRIGNQTFLLNRIPDAESPQKESANWQANMLRSAFGLERVKLEDDALLSMFDNNEPIE